MPLFYSRRRTFQCRALPSSEGKGQHAVIGSDGEAVPSEQVGAGAQLRQARPLSPAAFLNDWENSILSLCPRD